MNAAARAALEKFGPLPQDVLEGARRSRFAPPNTRRSRSLTALAETDPSGDTAKDDPGRTEPSEKSEDDAENAELANAGKSAAETPAGLSRAVPVVT